MNNLLKYLFVIAFFFLQYSRNCFAQEIVVKNIGQNYRDISASTHLRADENSIACALLKVFAVNKNIQFSGDVVGPIENKTNEYWVYMKKGSREIKISAPSFSSLTILFEDYDLEPLQSKVTYNITLMFNNTPREDKENGDNVKLSYPECKLAAESGTSTDFVNLGKCYLYGIGTNENPSEAARWFQKAAKRGNIEALFLMGDSFFYGIGNPKDYEIAFDYYTKAADNEFAPAIYALGLCYEQGKGVKQNIKKAIKYFEDAADKGYVKAVNKLQSYRK